MRGLPISLANNVVVDNCSDTLITDHSIAEIVVLESPQNMFVLKYSLLVRFIRSRYGLRPAGARLDSMPPWIFMQWWPRNCVWFCCQIVLIQDEYIRKIDCLKLHVIHDYNWSKNSDHKKNNLITLARAGDLSFEKIDIMKDTNHWNQSPPNGTHEFKKSKK